MLYMVGDFITLETHIRLSNPRYPPIVKVIGHVKPPDKYWDISYSIRHSNVEYNSNSYVFLDNGIMLVARKIT